MRTLISGTFSTFLSIQTLICIVYIGSIAISCQLDEVSIKYELHLEHSQ